MDEAGAESRVKTDLPVLGLIAGSRSLPLVLAEQAKALGVGRLVAVAFEGETDASLAGLVDEITWLRVGQLGRLIRFFKEKRAHECVMAGQIAPRNLFDVRPDFRAMALLWRLKEKNAHSVFGGIAQELHKEGIELLDGRRWLKPLLAEPGFRLGPKLSRGQEEDIQFGFRTAKAISALDIGQSVVVKEGTILAVEAFEGTDACLERGGGLAGKKGGAVAVKVAKKDHDFRFDIPCIGCRTAEVCARSGVSVLAVESERTLVLEREQMAVLTRAHRLTVIAVEEDG